MVYYLIITICVFILLAYIFDVTSKFTRIPGVILLILTGMLMRVFTTSMELTVPDLSVLLPVMGTLGLILVVMEGSLELKLSVSRQRLIVTSIASAIGLIFLSVSLFALISVHLFGMGLKASIITFLPLCIIGSTVAISAAGLLGAFDREFITYESAISGIIGILIFDFVLFSRSSIGLGALGFIAELIVSVIASILLSAGLALLLHRINHPVKYIAIMTVIVLVYAWAKLIHMPSLLVVLIFGLILNNAHLFRGPLTERLINFEEFSQELNAFRNMNSELSFVVRSFFFILFGFYTNITDLFNPANLALSALIVTVIVLLRALFLIALRLRLTPLLFFAPRGLLTVLLFLSIPETLMLPFMNEGIVTQVIFLTIGVMMVGNIFYKKTHLNTARI